eukprot:CAMPEP_0115705168 /NCGR_PEP_ID=MMETSP0272-20121206/70064_1 /TAXON_ID=71861 /ORGANISM="Scrippsiella trochoidea, Strain CCMP3099" /LENGTH=71 /DNA_ID=CAMNT_0003146233 /DNA_START=109 /DNA_END=321 /DNA_ORIENTATION=+
MYNELVHGALASGTWGRRWQPPVEALPHGEGGRPLAPRGVRSPTLDPAPLSECRGDLWRLSSQPTFSWTWL